jgi:hypothetical protein
MAKDRLFLLDNEFLDGALGRGSFYCRDCMLLNGLIAAFPEQASRLDIVRIPFPRPRVTVIEAIGEANQALPVLVLADNGPANLPTGADGGPHFVSDFLGLLQALHIRHGFPEPHP